jgi:hypothetical protein
MRPNTVRMGCQAAELGLRSSIEDGIGNANAGRPARSQRTQNGIFGVGMMAINRHG